MFRYMISVEISHLINNIKGFNVIYVIMKLIENANVIPKNKGLLAI